MIATLLVAGGFGARAKEEELTPIEDDDAPFEEIGDRGSVSLGWMVHAAMSAKARIWRLLTFAYRWLVASSPAPRALSFDRQEPNLGAGRAAPSLAPQADEEFDDEIDEDDEDEPVARAPRKKAGSPARRSANHPTSSNCRRSMCSPRRAPRIASP